MKGLWFEAASWRWLPGAASRPIKTNMLNLSYSLWSLPYNWSSSNLRVAHSVSRLALLLQNCCFYSPQISIKSRRMRKSYLPKS